MKQAVAKNVSASPTNPYVLRLELPVPPYHQPAYWEDVYRRLGPHDVVEWGRINYEDLHDYRYQTVLSLTETKSAGDKQDYTTATRRADACRLVQVAPANETELSSTSFVETLVGSDQDDASVDATVTSSNKSRSASHYLGSEPSHYPHNKPKGGWPIPILILGCGNSSFGEDMIRRGWVGPILQTDVSRRVVDAMAHRCNPWIQSGDMQVVLDDATVLSGFESGTVRGAVDKGLIDALHCANQASQCRNVMRSLHRVLRPGGIFCCLSFSAPEFLLPHLLTDLSSHHQSQQSPSRSPELSYSVTDPMWSHVQVRKVESSSNKILLYRFQKHEKK